MNALYERQHKAVTSYRLLNESVQQLLGRVEAQRETVAALEVQVTTLDSEVNVLTFTGTALQQLLNSVSVESMETVETLITYGLRSIFDDQTLAFRMDTDNKRGVQWMEPRLIQANVEAPILDAFGGGPATVVAFLLRLLVCRRLGLAPVVLLDESFSMVSSTYVENVGKLLRELSEKLGFTILLVTHQPGFIEHAHHAYEAVETSQGTTFKVAKRTAGAAD